MVIDASIRGREGARRITRRGGPWRVVRLGSRVSAVWVNVSRVGVGVGGSGDSGGMGNKKGWLGVVGAERRRVRVGVARSGVCGDASSSSSSMRKGKRRETTLVWPSSHVISSPSAWPERCVFPNSIWRSPKAEWWRRMWISKWRER